MPSLVAKVKQIQAKQMQAEQLQCSGGKDSLLTGYVVFSEILSGERRRDCFVASVDKQMGNSCRAFQGGVRRWLDRGFTRVIIGVSSQTTIRTS